MLPRPSRPVAEATLLSLAAQLEAALPWAQRLAPLAQSPRPPEVRGEPAATA